MFLTSTQKQKNYHQICPSYLLSPLARASEALARLDERPAYSPVGTGLIERLHFADPWQCYDDGKRERAFAFLSGAAARDGIF